MPQWIIDLFGSSLAPIVWVAFVAASVCVLAIVFLFVAKRFWGGALGVQAKHKGPRLAVVDMARIDEKRKLVLIRRDDVEHLVLVGGQTELLVEAGISHGNAAAFQAPPTREPTLVDAPRRPVAPQTPVPPVAMPTPEPAAPKADPAAPTATADAPVPSRSPKTQTAQPTQKAPPAPNVSTPATGALQASSTAPREERPTSVASRDEPPKRDVEAAGALAARVLREQTVAPQGPESTAPRPQQPTPRPAAHTPPPAPAVPPRSRATPTLPPQSQPERSSDVGVSASQPTAQSRRPRAFERIEPHIDAPLTAELNSSAKHDTSAERASSKAPEIEPESAAKAEPARVRNTAGSTSASRFGASLLSRTQSSLQAAADRGSTGSSSRGPLSVKSFAMAIQNRDERGKSESQPTPSRDESRPQATATQTTQAQKPTSAPAPTAPRKESDSASSLEDSLESFLSAELSSNFPFEETSAEPDRKTAAATTPEAPAPKPAGTATTAASAQSPGHAASGAIPRTPEPARVRSDGASAEAGSSEAAARHPDKTDGEITEPKAPSAGSESPRAGSQTGEVKATPPRAAGPSTQAATPSQKDEGPSRAAVQPKPDTPSQPSQPQSNQPQPARVQASEPAGNNRPAQGQDAGQTRSNIAAADRDGAQHDARLEEEMERLLGNLDKAEDSKQPDKKA